MSQIDGNSPPTEIPKQQSGNVSSVGPNKPIRRDVPNGQSAEGGGKRLKGVP